LVYLNVIINDENWKNLDFLLVGITTLRLCCGATKTEVKQQCHTRQQDT